MELIDIGGHTICPDKLSDGVIIDIGCRSFNFTSHPLFNNKKKYCIDVDPEALINPPEDVETLNVGIWDKKGLATFYRNGEGTCIKEVWDAHRHLYFTCKTITMDDLYEITGKNVDVLKLDCEGAEYIILGETFKPIPKQISVEFHYHCMPDKHNEVIDSILKRLMENYDAVNLNWEARHGAGFNYWDVLFIKRELVGGADDVDRTLIEIC